MHFVAVKTEGHQAHGMLFRTRDLLVRQRTQMISGLPEVVVELGRLHLASQLPGI